MFHCLPNSAWADWNLAEVAVQLGKMVEHPNQSQPNPGLRADESPCISKWTKSQRLTERQTNEQAQECEPQPYIFEVFSPVMLANM